jgi:hypothetical protein
LCVLLFIPLFLYQKIIIVNSSGDAVGAKVPKKYDFLLPGNHAELNPEFDTNNLTECSLYSEDELNQLRIHWISGVCSNFSRISFKVSFHSISLFSFVVNIS